MIGPRSAPTIAGRRRSSTSRDATSPTIPTGHGPWTIVAAASSTASGDVRASAIAVFEQVAARGVRRLEDRGELGGLGLVLGQEQARRVERLPHPAGRVQARRDRERELLQVDVRRRQAGHGQERGQPGPRRRPKPLQPELDDRAVLAEHGREIRHGADRGEIRQVEARPRRGAVARG